MELEDLRIFLTVIECGGITAAARQLHRVPSGITTRIQHLEESLGVALFFREGRQLVLTPKGHQLKERARELLALADDTGRLLKDARPGGRFRLGAMESTAASRLPIPLSEFHRLHPQVQLELHTGNTHDLIGKVLSNELDAALVAGPLMDSRLSAITAFSEELVIIADAAQPPIHSPKDVVERTLLTFAPGCAYRRCLEDWFCEAALPPQRIVEVHSYHAMLGCVIAGMGIGIMPHSVLGDFDSKDRLTRHLLPMTLRHATTLLIWRPEFESPAIRAFAQLLSSLPCTDSMD